MRKINLIYLGVLAQRRFGMKKDFKIIEFPPDAGEKVKVAIDSSLGTVPYGPAVPFEFDFITFEQIGNTDQGEYMWVGYSARANVLAIKEAS